MMSLSNAAFLSENLSQQDSLWPNDKLHLDELKKILENFSKRKDQFELEFYLLLCCVVSF